MDKVLKPSLPIKPTYQDTGLNQEEFEEIHQRNKSIHKLSTYLENINASENILNKIGLIISIIISIILVIDFGLFGVILGLVAGVSLVFFSYVILFLIFLPLLKSLESGLLIFHPFQKSYRKYIELDKKYNKLLQAYEIQNKKYLAYEQYLELKKTREGWMKFNPYRFEKEITLLFKKHGFKASTTKGSDDGGIDIIVEINNQKGAIQCKRYKSKVGPSTVRDLYGAMLDGKFSFGAVVCPSDFSDKAKEFAYGKNIRLLSIEEIKEMDSNDDFPYFFKFLLNS